MTDRSPHEPKGMPFIADLGDAIRRNPVSTALIGMGLLWLFTGDRAKAGAAEIARRTKLDRMPDVAADAVASGRATLHDVGERVGETLADVGDRAGSAAQAVRDQGAAAFERAADFGRTIPGTGADLFEGARSKLTDLFNEQPLMLGALGVAIGAGIAASLPSTTVEAELFGETSDEFKAQARGFAQQASARAEEMARDAVGAAAEEAHRQGLTPEAMTTAAADLGDKAKRVAEAAEDNLRLE
jgi:hypothetical protein